MKPHKITNAKTVTRSWYEIDASKAPMGRVATRIATILRGKHKRDFTPNIDMGDFVVVINVDKLKFTGRKIEQNKYFRHSGYLGGIKSTTLKEMNTNKPEEVLRLCVKRMIDEIKLRKAFLARLKLVKGAEHTYKIDKKI